MVQTCTKVLVMDFLASGLTPTAQRHVHRAAPPPPPPPATSSEPAGRHLSILCYNPGGVATRSLWTSAQLSRRAPRHCQRTAATGNSPRVLPYTSTHRRLLLPHRQPPGPNSLRYVAWSPSQQKVAPIRITLTTTGGYPSLTPTRRDAASPAAAGPTRRAASRTGSLISAQKPGRCKRGQPC